MGLAAANLTPYWIARSIIRTATIRTSVIDTTIRRVVQPMLRPIHHSSAQLINTGTMISGLMKLPDEANAERLAAPPDHVTHPPRARIA